MSMEIQRPGIRFSGRESVNSGLGLIFTPGKPVIKLVEAKKMGADGGDTFTPSVRMVKMIEPHHGQTDSTGAQVPANAQNDGVDMVTFDDGETALVGTYDLHDKGKIQRFEMDQRDRDGKVFPDDEEKRCAKITYYLTPNEAVGVMAMKFNALSAENARQKQTIASLRRDLAASHSSPFAIQS